MRIIVFGLLITLVCIQCKTNESVPGEDHKDALAESVKEADDEISNESTVIDEESRHTDDERTVTGRVLDEYGEAVIGANVLIQGTTSGTVTDGGGSFSLVVPDEASTLIVSYAGYETQAVDITTLSEIVVSLSAGTSLEEEVITGNSRKIMAVPEADHRVDASPAPASSAAVAVMSRASDAIAVRGVGGSADLPNAGQITAGEWNDLQNWKDWLELTTDPDYVKMQDHWGVYPEERMSVYVQNRSNHPVVGAQVTLTDQQGEIIWEAVSDHAGHAELWPSLFASSKIENYQIRVNYDDEEYVKGDVKSISNGSNDITLPVDCDVRDVVDIMFVVDATGSMGDEITFLQSELNDVLDRVTADNQNISYRTGAVFYRDDTDDYLTRVSDLTHKSQETIAFISEQSAQGGGDYPEAVEAGLEEALGQDWSDDALSKIIFLLLDAPPHNDEKTNQMIQEQIADASAEGIKLIPITASGINRETEFLMKYMAVVTNATYVFITDDSGIGGSHLTPLVDDFDVEKLNDLLVRLIANYTHNYACDINLQITGKDITLFPNPTSNRINLKSPNPITKVEILSNTGRVLITEEGNEQTEITIQLDNLIDGVYQVAIYSGADRITKSVIKVAG